MSNEYLDNENDKDIKKGENERSRGRRRKHQSLSSQDQSVPKALQALERSSVAPSQIPAPLTFLLPKTVSFSLWAFWLSLEGPPHQPRISSQSRLGDLLCLFLHHLCRAHPCSSSSLTLTLPAYPPSPCPLSLSQFTSLFWYIIT